MKNNIVLQLVKGTVKRDLKSHMVSFMILVLSFTFLFGGYSLIDGDQSIKKSHIDSTFGKWSYSYQDLSDDEIDEIKKNRLYDEMIQVDETLREKDRMIGANYNQSFFNMASIKLISGRLPSKENEIVIREDYPHSLNETICFNNEDYRVVGIVNAYDEKWVEDFYGVFTYQKPAVHVRTFIDSQNHFHTESNLIDVSENYFRTRSSVSTTEEMNILLFIAGISILIACFYDVDQLYEKTLLLKSIGMSSRQTHWYVILETYVLELFAILISLPLGVLSHLLIGYFYKMETGYSLGTIQFMDIGKYYLGLMGITFICTWLVIIYLSFKSLDGLVVKKVHTKLKKYHKASYLNMNRLTTRLLKGNKYCSFLVLMSLCFVFLSGKVIHNEKREDYYSLNGKCDFTYMFHSNEDIEIKDFVSENTNWNIEDSYSYLKYNRIVLNNEQFDGEKVYIYTNNDVELIEGKEDLNGDECLAPQSLMTSFYNEETGELKEITLEIHLGDELELYNEENQHIKTFRVAGIIEDYRIFVAPQKDVPMVYEKTVLISDKNIYKVLKENPHIELEYGTFGNVSIEQNSLENLNCIIIMFATVFTLMMYFIIYLFLKNLFKEINLLRCLGLTNKQVVQILMLMFMRIYFFVLILGLFVSFIEIKTGIFMIMMFVLFFVPGAMMTYPLLKGDVHYSPSDVKRFY